MLIDFWFRVGLEPECIPAFEDLKLRKSYPYIIYKVADDNKTIRVLKTGTRDDNYTTFLNEFDDECCMYAIYDFKFDSADGGKRSKLVFISWSPEKASVKQKMIYSSSKDALRRSLNGIHTEIQGTDYSEISHEVVLDKVSRRSN
jgi:cofilin